MNTLLIEAAIGVLSIGGTAFSLISCFREIRELKKQLAQIQTPSCLKARAKEYQAILRGNDYRELRTH